MSSASTENRILLWREIVNSIALVNRSHSLHFYALSTIFLFPIFFTLLVYPSFHLALFHPHYNLTQFSLSNVEIIALLVCTLSLVLFFICAVATITYSAVQAYHDTPINIVSSIKSIRNSFFPLLSTFMVSHTIFISITIILSLVLVVLFQILKNLGLIHDSNHFWISLILVIVPVLLWLQVNWSLAYVIAVVESKCGFETLRRSAYLVKGMRWLAFSTHLFYGLAMGAMVIGANVVFVLLGAGKADHWPSFSVTSQIVQCTVLGSLGMNQLLVLNVVLYIYCNDLKGEKLPLTLDDEKDDNIV